MMRVQVRVVDRTGREVLTPTETVVSCSDSKGLIYEEFTTFCRDGWEGGHCTILLDRPHFQLSLTAYIPYVSASGRVTVIPAEGGRIYIGPMSHDLDLYV